VAKKAQLIALTPEELSALPGFKRVPTFEVEFPKKTSSAAEAKAALSKWQGSVRAPPGEQPRPKTLAAVQLTADHASRLRAVHESDAPIAELISQEMGPDDVLGVTYSSLVAFNYTQMSSEYKTRLAAAKDTKAKEAVTDQWRQIVRGAQQAMAAAGQKGLTEEQLGKMASELGRNKNNFNAVANIANTAKVTPDTAPQKLGTGAFVTQRAVIASLPVSVSFPPTLCQQPFAQGSFTKHFGNTFSLSVTINVWCPTWTNPFKTCPHTYTLASLMYSVDLSVGYKVTCCGASAWGQAAAQVCGSIVGIQLCASCTASIVGVTGFSRNAVGGQCSYGLGITADLQCKFGSVTVLHVSAPFGWTIMGPCPPAGFC
jgi:hypothetical protein